MGPRIFTPREAGALVPELERIFYEFDLIREKIRLFKGKRDLLEMIWGEELRAESNPDHREFMHYSAEIEKAGKDFDSLNGKVADLEVVGKSVEQGIVDFYGVIEKRLVFLCWKRGEKGVSFYHHLDEGFQGRKPIPPEELTR